MCDFRPPPKHVINPYTNQPSGYRYMGVVDYCESIRWEDRKIVSEVVDDGVYHICCTGGHYSLFLGGKWFGYDYMVFDSEDCCCSISEFFDTRPLEEKYPEGIPSYLLVDCGQLSYLDVEINE